MIDVYVRHNNLVFGEFLGKFSPSDLEGLVNCFMVFPTYFDFGLSKDMNKVDLDGECEKLSEKHGAQFVVTDDQVYFEIVID